MSDYAAKGVLWYEGWNALNKVLEKYNLSIMTGARETFVVSLDFVTMTNPELAVTGDSIACNSYAEAVTVAVEEMIERVKGETR